VKNYNCDGDKCQSATGEVRVYPIGAGGNLILCRSCWEHENDFNYQRGREMGRPQDWPLQDWNSAKVYE
jgi:hypothetical protein